MMTHGFGIMKKPKRGPPNGLWTPLPNFLADRKLSQKKSSKTPQDD